MQDFEYINKKLGTKYFSNSCISWRTIVFDYKLSEEFIEKFFNKLPWKLVFQYQKLPEYIIEQKINEPKHTLFFEYWYEISKYQTLSEEFIEKYQNDLYWCEISKSQTLSEKFIEKHKDDVNWEAISTYQKLSEPFIEKYLNKLTFFRICCNQKISEKFIEKHIIGTEYQYEMLIYALENQTLSMDFLEKHIDIIDFIIISCKQYLTEDFIERHKDKISWYTVCCYQKLSESFIEKHKDDVDWNRISIYQHLSENFIKKFKDKVNWRMISMYQKLSDDFIINNYNFLKHSLIADYQKMSDNTIELLSIPVFKHFLWQYKSTDFKRQKLIETGKYECHNDYFIAYKAIRYDRYSLFNFQYQYLPGETYESHCDCTNNEDSFGLNVGTYEFAKRYLGDNNGLIVKCKIYYKDIGRIVHEADLDGFDLVFDNLKISNLNVDMHNDEHYCISTFTCSKSVFKNILKLIRSLKKLGDGGHSFSVEINNKSFSWDGDGSDRVEEINDIDCGPGTKTFDKNYKLFTNSMNTNNNMQTEELLKKLKPIIKESINNAINDKIIPKSFINAINKFKQDYIQTVQMTEDDFPMLDTSSGVESFYQVKDMEIKDGKWNYTLLYNDYNKTTYHESINLIVFDEDDNKFYFNGDYAKSYLSDLKKDLKKGIKYFKEYNPSFDDNENQRNNFLNNL